MFSVIVIVFEAVVILFISIFARTNDTTTSLVNTYFSLISDTLALMLAFTLMYTPFRKLSLISLLLLITVIAVAVQTSLLFTTFWSNCFNGFSTNFAITTALIIRCLFSSLAILLTVLDFIGLFMYWQVYFLMVPLMAIGYGLNESIIIYGLKTFDGGGGMTLFLYSGVCSLMIWALTIRGKVHPSRYKIKQSYINQTFAFIGVVIAFANWPKFNMGGALSTSLTLINTTTISITNLQNSALANTFIGLSTAILMSIIFASKQTKQDKLKFKCFIDCFINGGIIIASYQDILLNPSAVMVMTCISSIITLVIHKYFVTASESDSESMAKNMMKNYSKIVFRIIFSFLGAIIAAIVVGARNGTTPQLLAADYPKTAGLQIVAFIITLCFGLIFGLLTALMIKAFISSQVKPQGDAEVEAIKESQRQLTDFDYWQGLNDECHPLYYDIFDQINNRQEDKVNINDYTTMIIKQSLLDAQDNPLRMTTQAKPYETRVTPRKPELSDDRESDKQDEGKIRVNPSLTANKSKIKVSEDEKLPNQQISQKNVARKLVYQDNQEPIQNQK